MALLTLEADEGSPCCWPAIEHTLRSWWPDLRSVARHKHKRTYRLILADHSQPIPLLRDLQTLLGPEDIHFFVDLKS